MNRKTIALLLMSISMLIGLLFITSCHVEKIITVEEKALKYLINTINDSTFLQNSRSVFAPIFEKDARYFKDSLFYSNSTLCLISQLPPGIGYSGSLDRITQKNIDEFLSYSDSLNQSNYSPVVLPQLQGTKKMNFEEFKKTGMENSYFFTLRHHLRSQDIYFVEINLVPYAKSYNPFEYTFHIFLEKDEIFIWEFSIQESFEYEIDC